MSRRLFGTQDDLNEELDTSILPPEKKKKLDEYCIIASPRLSPRPYKRTLKVSKMMELPAAIFQTVQSK